ncbi:MAG: hypothetical protein IPP79_18815 [Chitinophagaceae bacterium]|nr:hypothetical protein [Chitinophagaceae bacterium]
MTKERLRLSMKKMKLNARLEYSTLQPNPASPNTRIKVYLPYSLSKQHTDFQSSYDVVIQPNPDAVIEKENKGLS